MSFAEMASAPDWLAKIKIRQLLSTDLSALEWEGAYTSFRRVYARAWQRARRGEAVLWVADLGGNILVGQLFVLLLGQGDLSLADGRDLAFIHSFRVRPEFRGHGVGTSLLSTAEKDLVRRGFKNVSLNVARENEAAIRLYEHKGYRRLYPVAGDWTYDDHLGVVCQVHEPGWRMVKSMVA